MWNIVQERLRQGHRTIAFPAAPAPPRSARFRGLPVLDNEKCDSGCQACADVCPTGAISVDPTLRLDLGRCLFCTECIAACPTGAVEFSTDYRLATRGRDDLVLESQTLELARALEEKTRALFQRSLMLRVVSAAGCNACEADLNVLNTVVFDLSRFGIQFVASPRHADGMIITGPISANMHLAVKKTYDAIPAPKIVIAVGACAISGGPYIGHALSNDGADSVVPVDLYIPGCPPHPLTILDGLLRLLGRLPEPENDKPLEAIKSV